MGYMESEWGSKLGCQDSEMQYFGEKVSGCGLEIFDLVGCNVSCQHIGLGRGLLDVLSLLWVLRGLKGGQSCFL